MGNGWVSRTRRSTVETVRERVLTDVIVIEMVPLQGHGGHGGGAPRRGTRGSPGGLPLRGGAGVEEACTPLHIASTVVSSITAEEQRGGKGEERGGRGTDGH